MSLHCGFRGFCLRGRASRPLAAWKLLRLSLRLRAIICSCVMRMTTCMTAWWQSWMPSWPPPSHCNHAPPAGQGTPPALARSDDQECSCTPCSWAWVRAWPPAAVAAAPAPSNLRHTGITVYGIPPVVGQQLHYRITVLPFFLPLNDNIRLVTLNNNNNMVTIIRISVIK